MDERSYPPPAGGASRAAGGATAHGRVGPTRDGPLDDHGALTILDTTEHWTGRRPAPSSTGTRRCRSRHVPRLSGNARRPRPDCDGDGVQRRIPRWPGCSWPSTCSSGLASLGRITAATNEDIRYLQGMHPLRHAYLEMVPGLDRYFITSAFDDYRSATTFYGQAPLDSLGATLQPALRPRRPWSRSSARLSPGRWPPSC